MEIALLCFSSATTITTHFTLLQLALTSITTLFTFDYNSPYFQLQRALPSITLRYLALENQMVPTKSAHFSEIVNNLVK